MASGNQSQPKKKADVLIMLSRATVTKADAIMAETQLIDTHLESIMEHSKLSHDENLRQTDGIYKAVEDSYSKLSDELSYMAMQNQSIFTSLQEKLDGLGNGIPAVSSGEQPQLASHSATVVGVSNVAIDYDLIAERVAERIPAPTGDSAVGGVVSVNQIADFDYEALSQRLAEKLSVQEAISPDYIASKVAEQIVVPTGEGAEIDYELLARRVAQYIGPVSTMPAMPAMTVLPAQSSQQMDYEYLADKIVNKMSAEMFNQPQSFEINYDLLADKVAERMPSAQSAAPIVDINYEELADMVASRMRPAQFIAPAVEIDYEKIVDMLAARMPASVAQAAPDSNYAIPEYPEVDYEALADKVSERVLASKDPMYETPEFDYERIADMVAGRLPESISQETTATGGVNYDYLADKLSERIPVAEAVAQVAEIDYDLLAKKVSEYMPANTATLPQDTVLQISDLDYELLAQKVSEYVLATAVAEEINEISDLDYETLAAKIADLLPAPVVEKQDDPLANLDYDKLAQKVAELIPEPEVVEPEPVYMDYEEMAFRITEHMPAPIVEVKSEDKPQIDCDAVAKKVVELMPATEAAAKIDYEELAVKISEIIPAPVVETSNEDFDYDRLASKIAEIAAIGAVAGSATVNIDEEEIADQIVTKLGSIKADDFDIIVDDYGCDALSKAICENINYETLATSLADKLRAVVDFGGNDIDADELAARLSEKLSLANISEDAIAEKVGTSLSNLMPEIDCDDIADKIASQLINTLPQEISERTAAAVTAVSVENRVEVDYDTIADKVSTQVISALPPQEEPVEFDYDVLADKLSSQVVSALPQEEPVEFDYDGLADKVTSQVLHALPESIFVSREPAEESGEPQGEVKTEEEAVTSIELDYEALAKELSTYVTSALPDTTPRFDSIDKDLDEILALLEGGVKVVQETAVTELLQDEEKLVTVSDVVDEAPGDTSPDEGEEGDNDPKTLPSVDDIIQIGAELSESPDGVDFANMMKFNRSFIARIIQSTDEQKDYYGRLKTALLSYKKVNSNIAWAAERFHKGRETIARMKIRGKTLMLYLALDPNEFPETVYHQKDVSDNKSLAGTPLAVKVMSPLGVKKAIRLIDTMLERREGVKRNVPERNYAEMYPYESIEELIEDGLVQDMRKG